MEVVHSNIQSRDPADHVRHTLTHTRTHTHMIGQFRPSIDVRKKNMARSGVDLTRRTNRAAMPGIDRSSDITSPIKKTAGTYQGAFHQLDVLVGQWTVLDIARG